MSAVRRWLRRILIALATLVALVLAVAVVGGLMLAPTPPPAWAAVGEVPPPAIDTLPLPPEVAT